MNAFDAHALHGDVAVHHHSWSRVGKFASGLPRRRSSWASRESEDLCVDAFLDNDEGEVRLVAANAGERRTELVEFVAQDLRKVT